MKRKSDDSKSLKTFFIYAGIVLFFIAASLAIKAFFVFQQSKFDGKQQFVITIAKEEKVKEIIAFNPSASSVSVLLLKGSDVSSADTGKVFGLMHNANVNATFDLPIGSDSTQTMTAIAWRYHALKTDMTLFDIARLIFLSKQAPGANHSIREFTMPSDSGEIDSVIKKIFTDESLSSDNVSIQIINASDAPGLGTRLERALANTGGNIVAVSSSRKQKHSKIQYFGEESYTLNSLKIQLGYPIEKMERESVATIIITIGEDSRDTKIF